MISSGRIGGEEFASLLPNTTPQDALWLAEQVRAAVEIRSSINAFCRPVADER